MYEGGLISEIFQPICKGSKSVHLWRFGFVHASEHVKVIRVDILHHLPLFEAAARLSGSLGIWTCCTV